MTCHAQRNHATCCFLLRSLGTCLGKCSFFFEDAESQPREPLGHLESWQFHPISQRNVSVALEGLFSWMFDMFDVMYFDVFWLASVVSVWSPWPRWPVALHC